MNTYKGPKKDAHVKGSENPRTEVPLSKKDEHGTGRREDEERDATATRDVHNDTVQGRDERLDRENAGLDLEDGTLPNGTQSGQTSRGSYSTDPSTGAGRYADHRSGQFGTEDVAQPGDDNEKEPDPIDPKI